MVQNLAISIPSISSEDLYSRVIPQSEASADVPLTALSKNTRKQLSFSLNAKKILRSEDGYERDWRGIAVLAQQNSLCNESTIGGDDPMMKVLHFWCTHNPKTATIGNLEKFLGIIDRWDVSDDVSENLVEDARVYLAQVQNKSLTENEDVAQASSTEAISSTTTSTTTDGFGLGSDPNILTNDDVLRAQQGLPPQMYDAFVLFAVSDMKYAVEMIERLEEHPQYNFKLCLKDRNLLAGVAFDHVALTQLIEERCKHLIVILTQDFIKSPEIKFLVNYTQDFQIKTKTRKIIPLLYDDHVDIPRTLKIYTHLKYSVKNGPLFNFWEKLAASIRNVNIVVESPPPVYSKEIYNQSVSSKCTVYPTKAVLSKCPSPPTEIPSININGEAVLSTPDGTTNGGNNTNSTIPKKKERLKFAKRLSLRQPSNKSLLAENSANNGNGDGDGAPVMTSAVSTSHLPAYSVSMSDLMTSDLKEKKKELAKQTIQKSFYSKQFKAARARLAFSILSSIRVYLNVLVISSI